MGLDAVELVLEIEDMFSVEIPNDEASSLVVLEDLVQYVSDKTKGTPTECTYVIAYSRISSLLVSSYGVPEAEIHPGADIVQDLGLD